jgi:hypothetical protein
LWIKRFISSAAKKGDAHKNADKKN